MYLSLYRKHRPQKFAQVVGQQHVTRTLTNALAHQRVGHAYLFSGPRGTGKTTVAKLLAKALNCKRGPSAEPCGECDSCSRISSGYSMDVVEIDAASNRGIDEIRNLRESVKFAPSESRFKVYIIDEVHMLTTEAFNALLKTLEEPPAHVVFVLATTEPGRLPPTVTSRCQRFDFRRLTVQELGEQVDRVARGEGFSVSPEASEAIARLADGSSRDALSLLEQCAAFADRELSASDVYTVLGAAGSQAVGEFCRACERGDLAAALGVVQRLSDEGKDLRRFLRDAVDHYRGILLTRKTAAMADARAVGDAVEILAGLEGSSRGALRPRVSAEVAAIRLCKHWAPSAPRPAYTGLDAAAAEAAAPPAEAEAEVEVEVEVEPAGASPAGARASGKQPAGEASGGAEQAPDVWVRALDELKRAGKLGLATCLAGAARLLETESPAVCLEVGNGGARLLLEDPAQRQAVEKAVSSVLRRPVRLVVRDAAPIGAAATPAAAGGRPDEADTEPGAGAATEAPVGGGSGPEPADFASARQERVGDEPRRDEPRAAGKVAGGRGQAARSQVRDRKLAMVLDVLGGVVLVPGEAQVDLTRGDTVDEGYGVQGSRRSAPEGSEDAGGSRTRPGGAQGQAG